MQSSAVQDKILIRLITERKGVRVPFWRVSCTLCFCGKTKSLKQVIHGW